VIFMFISININRVLKWRKYQTGHYDQKEGVFYNWNRTQKNFVLPENYRKPSSIEEIVKIVEDCKRSKNPVHAVGSYHTFNDLPFSRGVLVNMRANFNKIISINIPQKTIVVQAGADLEEISSYLQNYGLTLANTGSFNKQTVAGAICTGMHGMGGKMRNTFIDSIIDMEIVNGLGEVIVMKEPSKFVNFGMLGIITRVTIQAIDIYYLEHKKSFETWETATQNLKDQFQNNGLLEITGSIHSSSCCVDTYNKVEKFHVIYYLWSIMAQMITSIIRFIIGEITVNSRSWRIHKFMIFIKTMLWRMMIYSIVDTNTAMISSSNTSFLHHQTEWAVTIDSVSSAVKKLRQVLKAEKKPVELVIRFSPETQKWMCPEYRKDVAYLQINLPYNMKNSEIQHFLKIIQQTLGEYDGIPHLAKLFYAEPEYIRKSYTQLGQFLDFVKKWDPERIFANDFTKRVFDY